ncbi:MAG: peptide-methionine (S)-S-oxide reductase [Candidatus Omnitrophota bacterium]
MSAIYADVALRPKKIDCVHTPGQDKVARISKKKLGEPGKYKESIVNGILPVKQFYKAQEYRQRYYEKRGLKPKCTIPLK